MELTKSELITLVCEQAHIGNMYELESVVRLEYLLSCLKKMLESTGMEVQP